MLLQIGVWRRSDEGWSCTLSHSFSCFRWLRTCSHAIEESERLCSQLSAELKIFSCEERYAFKVSSEAADVWRVMAKDTRT